MDIVTIEGGFRVPKDSHIGKWCIESQKLCHDEFLPYCADPFIKSGDTVIDVGAFVGDHTTHYSDLVGQSGRVMAIEPGDIAYQCLEHNRRLFKFNNTLACHYGVSDHAGFADHLLCDNLGASICKESEHGEVTTITLYLLFRMFNLKRVDFIKIDAEGWEMKILRGAKKLLNMFTPTIMIEINRDALTNNGSSEEEIFDFLGELGYSFFCVNLEIGPREPQYDVICQHL